MGHKWINELLHIQPIYNPTCPFVTPKLVVMVDLVMSILKIKVVKNIFLYLLEMKMQMDR